MERVNWEREIVQQAAQTTNCNIVFLSTVTFTICFTFFFLWFVRQPYHISTTSFFVFVFFCCCWYSVLFIVVIYPMQCWLLSLPSFIIRIIHSVRSTYMESYWNLKEKSVHTRMYSLMALHEHQESNSIKLTLPRSTRGIRREGSKWQEDKNILENKIFTHVFLTYGTYICFMELVC